MAKSGKDIILTIAGGGAAIGIMAGTQGFLGPIFAPILAIAACIFVMFFDYFLYYSKTSREKIASNNIICEKCFAVLKEDTLQCPKCGSNL